MVGDHEGGEMEDRPGPRPWNTVIRVLYATAAVLGSAATLVTAVNGWGHL
jgi:hypothetical protein